MFPAALHADRAIDVASKGTSDIRASISPHGLFTAQAVQGQLQLYAGHRSQDPAERAGVTALRGDGDIRRSCLLYGTLSLQQQQQQQQHYLFGIQSSERGSGGKKQMMSDDSKPKRGKAPPSLYALEGVT